jgi:hypothetical protein
MPTYRDRNVATVEAIYYTGTDPHIIQAWAEERGAIVTRFLDVPNPVVCIRDEPTQPYYIPIPAHHYLVLRPGHEPWVMEGQWFEAIYEEVQQ